ncbi:MAG: PP0621 family protein [Rhodoferax sp.]|nr:PP0621 family protein [Rhodoferax sp.]
MKYLLLLLVALLIVWQWRTYRDRKARQQPPPRGSAKQPLEMVSCSQCGMHIAASDAVVGRLGSYCSAAHLQRHEA